MHLYNLNCWHIISFYRKLVADLEYVCRKGKSKARPIDGRTVTEVDNDGNMLDVEAMFCYLGDMLCSGGGCDSDVDANYCVVWG